jgi:hypothetical protein
MATAGDIGNRFRSTVILYEGNATRADVQISSGLLEKGVTYASKIAVGDFVEIYTAADNSVTTASPGQAIIGRIVTEPSGVPPNISADAGVWTWSATPGSGARIATVEWLKGHCIRRILCHSAANRGDTVGIKNKTTVTSSTVSAQIVGVLLETASSASTVRVLFY